MCTYKLKSSKRLMYVVIKQQLNIMCVQNVMFWILYTKTCPIIKVLIFLKFANMKYGKIFFQSQINPNMTDLETNNRYYD